MSVKQTILRRAAAMVATLALVAGANTARASASVDVTFNATSYHINPAFNGFSYEKSYMQRNLFRGDNTALINCFTQVGQSGVLRIGGTSVDEVGWNGENGLPSIDTGDVDRLAAFMNALPSGWKVIYGINLRTNNVSSVAAEASYAALQLGSRLQSFEIGNEPNHFWSSVSGAYLTLWSSYKAQAKKYGPVEGADSGGNVTWTTDFAASQDQTTYSAITLLTQHYYRDNPANWVNNITGAMTMLLTPDSTLPGKMQTCVSSAYTHHVSQGFRVDECNSFSNGGLAGVSDAFGAALWTLDFMFAVAMPNGQGVNFHTGSNNPYCPIKDDHTYVTGVGPVLYGMKMFSFLPLGKPCTATITTLSGNPGPFTAYGVLTNGYYAALLNNKNNNNTITVTVHVGSSVSHAHTISLNDGTGNLYSTTGFVLGGSAIHPDGTWNGTWNTVNALTLGEFTVTVNSHSALLLIPF